VQQQVSQAYVPLTTTTTLADAIKTMTREILSRARLLAIIDELSLYPKDKAKVTPEALVERMRNEVDIQPLDLTPLGNFSAFKISFTADSPSLAQTVTSRLTSLFIEENLKTRGNQAARTTSFLTQQLEAAKQKLAEQEQSLRDFRMSHLGELPEQQAANVGILTDLRMHLTNTMGNLSRAQQQGTSLASLIGGNLAKLQSERSALLTRFTPRHPEVIKKNREIARVQALLEPLKGGTPGIEDPTGSEAPDDPFLAQLRSQVASNTVEIKNLSKEEQRLRAEIATYQNRVNLTPVREQQLAGILRDYELYKKDYSELLNKQLQSQLTVSLEERQEGQQFRLVDPPTLPIVPSSPKRLKISLGGVVAGCVLGLALALLMDFRQGGFHGEKELGQRFAMRLVVGVPLLLTPAERRACKWKTAFEWLAASVMTLAVFAAEFYVYRHS
jgi:polysaccharide chain length determinant protein (PEP-CTERM system associated)